MQILFTMNVSVHTLKIEKLKRFKLHWFAGNID